MKKKGNVSLNELITEKIVLLESNGKPSTAHNYRTLLHFVQKHFGVVMMADCGPDFVWKMDGLLGGYSPSTKATYYACFKSIWNYAAYKGWTKGVDYPFQRHSYEIDRVKAPKVLKRTEWWMSRDEMSELYRQWLSMADSTSKRYVGMFLASYLMNGANINDLVRLTYNRDYFRSDGTVFSFVRHKTADKSPTTVRVPITEWLRPILDYMSDEPTSGGLVFGSFVDGYTMTEAALRKRVMTINSCMGKHLKKVLGRPDVSPTTARHSFVTVANHLGFNFSIIEQMAGHTISGPSGHYIGAAPIEQLFAVSNALIV